MDRAVVFGTKGCGFNSRRAHGVVSRSGGVWTPGSMDRAVVLRNRKVEGSTPAGRTSRKAIMSRSERLRQAKIQNNESIRLLAEQIETMSELAENETTSREQLKSQSDVLVSSFKNYLISNSNFMQQLAYV